MAQADADAIANNRDIAQVIPLALGDNVEGFRIVGTNPNYIALYKATYDQGRAWTKPFEAVAGAYAAQSLHLKPGSEFEGSHGLGAGGHHHADKYKITGVLKPTGTIIDRLVLTSVESVQDIHHEGKHEDHDEHAKAPEITALLVEAKNPRAVINLPRMINRDTQVMAASPAMELTRLTAMMGISSKLLIGAAIVLMVMAALSIFSGLASSLESRSDDLAVMRLLGMSRKRLFSMIVAEAGVTALLGALMGLIAGHLLFAAVIAVIEPLQASGASALVFRPGEVILFVTVVAAGLLAALIPALRAYRTDVSGLLRGSS
jgi:putative ABC transport system permease protein